MYDDEERVAGIYYWCAVMGPKGDTNISKPYRIVIRSDGVGVFDDKAMGTFHMTKAVDAMWSRMAKCSRGAYDNAMKLIESSDPVSAEKIRRKEAEFAMRQEASSPPTYHNQVPAWHADEYT